jgi:hypothetical protein
MSREGINQLPVLDYLIIRDNCFAGFKRLGEILPDITLVFDGSNTSSYVKRSMDRCRELGIRTYDTSEKGCFLLKIPVCGVLLPWHGPYKKNVKALDY